MKITEADVDYVARLANLEVHADERAELAAQLSRIVEHVEQLNTVDVSSVEPTTQTFHFPSWALPLAEISTPPSFSPSLIGTVPGLPMPGGE